jgi:hypothetical protein
LFKDLAWRSALPRDRLAIAERQIRTDDFVTTLLAGDERSRDFAIPVFSVPQVRNAVIGAIPDLVRSVGTRRDGGCVDEDAIVRAPVN